MVCKDISLDTYLSTNYRKEKETLDGRGLSWSFTTTLELVDLALHLTFTCISAVAWDKSPFFLCFRILVAKHSLP